MKYSLAAAVIFTCLASAAAAPPVTEKIPVTDVYHGVQVVDPYRWLEDWDDAKVKTWSDAQNKYARSILGKLPNVDAIRRRVTEIMSAESVSYSSVAHRNGSFFVVKTQPPKQQPFLVVMPSPQRPDEARVLFDPNAVDAQGTTVMDWYEPSPDGKLVALSLSKGGSEVGDVHLIETATGKLTGEVVPRVNSGTAGGDLAWAADGSGFYYTRHPHPGERPASDLGFYQQLYFHRIGTSPADDRYELGKGFPRIAEIEVETHASGLVLVTVQNGDGGEFAHYLRRAEGDWQQFSKFGDKIVQATFQPDGDLLAISRRGAPRGKILRLSSKQLDFASTLVPASAGTVVTSFYRSPPSLMATESRIFVTYQLGGPSEIRVFDYDGNRVEGPQQLPVATVSGLAHINGDDVVFMNTSFVAPPAFYRFDASQGKTVKSKLVTDSPVDFADVEVVREFATSKDGTKIPVNVMIPKSAGPGPHPAVLYGYGGYNVNVTPRFRSARKVLLEQGMIYAVANIRGGGEYGEEWHLGGNLTNKQNVFDDFAAAAQYLIDKKYTSSDKLATMGGSNGGLLMGATMTQHPNLMKCVVSYVGIYDMLRVELSPNGVFNIPEFGTVKNPDHFRALYAYSPYHNVKDDTSYPATLFLTGANDPRVDPMQSRKMTARLQATETASPILLRTSPDSGHGGDTALSERIEQTVDVDAFLFHFLGVEYKPVRDTATDSGT